MQNFFLFIHRILSTPKIFVILLLIWLACGVYSIYSFYMAGIILYFATVACISVMLYISFSMFYVQAGPKQQKIQVVLIFITLFFIGWSIKYYITINHLEPVAWEPLQFQYGEVKSQVCPCDNFFSGKLEDGQPLWRSGTLGFGFCRDNRTEPIYQIVQKQIPFIIYYNLEQDVLIAATFEGMNDVDLTKPFSFILKSAKSGERIINLSKFEWLNDELKIKHLKFNFIVIPCEDLILVKFLLFAGMDEWLNGTYLIP
jgi:hypothetical protein